MSNPAVIKLSEKKLRKSRVYLDDNYGESIHIHIDDYRVDLTVSEFEQMYNDICISLNSLVSVENFNAFDIDPVFMSYMLWKNLEHLVEVKFDNVNLEDMICPYQTKMYKMKDSVGVSVLKGKRKETAAFRKCNHVGQSDEERYQSLCESIKKNGYPYNNNYIVMYGDDNIIRDGQHRAACLYCLYGNKKVPVIRFYFDNYESPKINSFYNSRIGITYRVFKHASCKYIKIARSLLKRLCRKFTYGLKDNGRNKSLFGSNELNALFSSK